MGSKLSCSCCSTVTRDNERMYEDNKDTYYKHEYDQLMAYRFAELDASILSSSARLAKIVKI